MKRNKEQERDLFIAIALLLGYPLFVLACAVIWPYPNSGADWAILTFPIWMFASIYFHSCSEVWTWEQIKEQKSKEKFIPPEAIDKEEDEGL
jgi:hypothetical protein